MAFGVAVYDSVCGEHTGLLHHVWNYNILANGASTRFLAHSDGTVIQYDVLPTDTVGFAWSPMQHRDFVTTKTLGSTKTAVWDCNVDDLIIKEVFEPTGGLSMPWGQLLAMYGIYKGGIDWDAGETLTWAPLDRTCTRYPVDVINMLVDGEEFDPKWRGNPTGLLGGNNATCGAPANMLDVASGSRVEIWYRIRPEAAPNVSMFLTAGSFTSETNSFEVE